MREWLRTLVDTVLSREDETDKRIRLPTLIVPAKVCEETARGLQSHSPPDNDHEGVVYWAGVADDTLEAKFVLTVIMPEATTTPGSYDVSSVANATVVEAVHDHNLELIGTVHSHPGEKTSHSERDDEEAQLPHEGYYSVIVPNYAHDGIRPFTNCGVHVYRDDEFEKLDAETIESNIRSVPSPPSYIDTRN